MIENENPVSRPRVGARRMKIVAAFAVGLMVGTSGLATAGALPDGPQEVAHRTLGAIGLNVPHGDRYWGEECAGEVKKNHGQYVRSQPKDKRAEAAASRCGKPVRAGAGDDDPAGAGGGKSAGCQGPPPWAGKGKPDEAAKAARKQACGQSNDENDETVETTTTTVPSSTATTETTATTATTTPSEPASTTSTSVGSGGTPAPSLPIEPPAVGQAS